jgi:hypothetical protein
MCGSGDRRDVWRGGGAASWRVEGVAACGVAAWKALWAYGVEVWLAGRGRSENEMRESDPDGEVGIWVFFFFKY